MTKILCAAAGCKRPAKYSNGLCHTHYQRERAHGTTAPRSVQKLTNAQVRAIRAYKPRRGLNLELAKKFGVSESTISKVRLGQRRVKV